MTEPATNQATPRKKTELRIEADLWERAQAQARRLRMSANAYVCNAVEKAVLQDEQAARG
jgi:predicted HicB family RNase H-like nuclease